MTLTTPRVRTLQDLRDFTAGNDSFDLEPVSRCDAYRFIEATYKQFDYPHLGKADKGALKAYLGKATGLSRSQLTRLIGQCRKTGTLRDRRGTPGKPYPRRYTPEDVALLAETDRLHETLSGPAIRHICRRQYQAFGDQRYRRLASISVGHLYRLRKTPAYQRRNRRVQPPGRSRPRRSASDGGRSRTGGRAFCASTPCTRATCMACGAARRSRACTTSTGSMRSPSGRRWWRCRP